MQTGTHPYVDYDEYKPNGGHTVTGSVKVFPALYSPQLRNRRDVLVYLPPGYEHGACRYPVLYMHDGQNLFDEVTSYAGEWHVDETCELLQHEGLEAIVVGVANIGERRLDEYGPFRSARGDGGRGDAYLGFLANTLKPLIDATFRTIADREHTGIMGSSMGGLISLYACFKRPETFGLIGAMSPSLWFAGAEIFPFVRRSSFSPARIYLDIGTLEGGSSSVDRLLRDGSRRYSGNVFRMHELLVAKGYQPGRDLAFVEEQGGIHQESAWARRLPGALRFLLRDRPPACPG
jgi:predicted alpha/beta superfamily hydrolase